MTRHRPPTPLRTALGLVVLSLGMLACGDDAADSAVSDLPAGAPLRLDPEPRLSMGAMESSDPMAMLDGVAGPFLMPNGDLIVPNRGDNTIRRFDSTGEFVERMGGTGEGPGEFQSLRNAWARGATIEAYDGRGYRITRFPITGDPESFAVRGSEWSIDLTLGPLEDGWAVLGLTAGQERDQLAVYALDAHGSVRLTMAPKPGFVRRLSTEVDFRGPHPLSPTALYWLQGDEIYAAETLTPQVDVYGPDGGLRRTIPLPLPVASPAEEALEAVRERASEVGTDPAWLSAYLSLPEDSRTPLYGGLLVDDLRFVWIQLYDARIHAFVFRGSAPLRPGAGGEWMILTQEGVEVGRITIPEGLQLSQVTANAVVGVRKDELDVEHVEVHSLERR